MGDPGLEPGTSALSERADLGPATGPSPCNLRRLQRKRRLAAWSARARVTVAHGRGKPRCSRILVSIPHFPASGARLVPRHPPHAVHNLDLGMRASGLAGSLPTDPE